MMTESEKSLKFTEFNLRVAKSCRTCKFRLDTSQRKGRYPWPCKMVECDVSLYTVCDKWELASVYKDFVVLPWSSWHSEFIHFQDDKNNDVKGLIDDDRCKMS